MLRKIEESNLQEKQTVLRIYRLFKEPSPVAPFSLLLWKKNLRLCEGRDALREREGRPVLGVCAFWEVPVKCPLSILKYWTGMLTKIRAVPWLSACNQTDSLLEEWRPRIWIPPANY